MRCILANVTWPVAYVYDAVETPLESPQSSLGIMGRGFVGWLLRGVRAAYESREEVLSLKRSLSTSSWSISKELLTYHGMRLRMLEANAGIE